MAWVLTTIPIMYRLYSLLLCLLPFSGFTQSFTEISFSLGKGHLTSDLPAAKAYSVTLKRVARPLEDVYISYGLGGTRFKDPQPFPPGQADPPQEVGIVHATLGAGYIFGKDKLVFTIGADVVPSYYLVDMENQFVVGYSPNVTVSRKVGKNMRLGVTGKVMFLPPSLNLLSFTPTFMGGGLVLQGL